MVTNKIKPIDSRKEGLRRSILPCISGGHSHRLIVGTMGSGMGSITAPHLEKPKTYGVGQ